MTRLRERRTDARLHGEHAVALLSTRRQTLELLGLLSEPDCLDEVLTATAA